jgi:hypothetical protein
MKKLLLTFVFFFLFVSFLFSQSPQSFKYQAIARDTEGNLLSGKQISLRINLIQGTEEGKIVYSEIHNVATNNFGLFNLAIGTGNEKNGDFNTIDWSSGLYFVGIDMDVNGGKDFISMGISQLLSVPYALYAERSGDAGKNAGTWTETPNGAYLTNPYYKLGIGTTDPSKKLTVSASDASIKLIDSDGPGASVIKNSYGHPGQPCRSVKIPQAAMPR